MNLLLLSPPLLPFCCVCAAELLAAVLSCSIFAFVSGLGPLNPFSSFHDLNLTWPEAMWMWVTGETICLEGGLEYDCSSRASTWLGAPLTLALLLLLPG